MSILETRRQLWPDEAACAASATALAQRPGIHDAFIELRGPLGAGKTTFVRYLLHALGVTGRVKSPTYAVMEPYELRAVEPGQKRDPQPDRRPDQQPDQQSSRKIWHFDFYRFNDPQEWEDAGFRDVFASTGLKLAEWPDKAAGLLPVADLVIAIEPTEGDRRAVAFSAHTALGRDLL